MKSIINIPFVLLFAFVVEGKAQQSIYHGDWIDFNKNGKKDLFEDSRQPTEAVSYTHLRAHETHH
jgi:beta-glucosidase